MIEQKAKVLRCRGSRICVRLGAQTGCAACDAGQGCGAGLFARLLRRKPAEIELDRGDLDVRPGQMITLAFPEKTYLKLVLIFYAWPLLAALVAALFVDNLMADMPLGSTVLDATTLAAALLAGALALRVSRSINVSNTLLESLQLAAAKDPEYTGLCDGPEDRAQSQ